MKKTLISAAVIAGLVLVALIVQVVSRRVWDARVWSCYAALGGGEHALPVLFRIPSQCKATDIFVNRLGTPDAEVILGFRPPLTMWISYLARTADYDTYTIELRTRGAETQARIHHGSD